MIIFEIERKKSVVFHTIIDEKTTLIFFFKEDLTLVSINIGKVQITQERGYKNVSCFY